MADSFEQLKIADFKFWSVYLNENQNYLGRCVVWYKKDVPLDIFEIDDEEWREYKTVMNKLKKALHEAFAPDMFNYETLENVVHHIHTHVSPRYNRTISFAETDFGDSEWGGPPNHNRANLVSKNVLQEIKLAVAKHF